MPVPATPRKPPVPRAIATFSLPVEELVAVDQAAVAEGQNRSEFIREAAIRRARRVLARAIKAA